MKMACCVIHAARLMHTARANIGDHSLTGLGVSVGELILDMRFH